MGKANENKICSVLAIPYNDIFHRKAASSRKQNTTWVVLFTPSVSPEGTVWGLITSLMSLRAISAES